MKAIGRLAACISIVVAGRATVQTLSAQDAAGLDTLPRKDRLAYFADVAGDGAAGTARKTMLVDARPAVPGEVVVSIIAGEGV